MLDSLQNEYNWNDKPALQGFSLWRGANGTGLTALKKGVTTLAEAVGKPGGTCFSIPRLHDARGPLLLEENQMQAALLSPKKLKAKRGPVQVDAVVGEEAHARPNGEPAAAAVMLPAQRRLVQVPFPWWTQSPYCLLAW